MVHTVMQAKSADARMTSEKEGALIAMAAVMQEWRPEKMHCDALRDVSSEQM